MGEGMERRGNEGMLTKVDPEPDLHTGSGTKKYRLRNTAYDMTFIAQFLCCRT